MARIGILGGSFNPVHIGHLRLALEVQEHVKLDRVEFVPARIPPHKGNLDLLPFDFRCGLLETVLRDMDGFEVNRVEGEREGPSYTVDTLLHLHATRPSDEFSFILGTTDLLTLPTWHRWTELFQQAHIVTVDRGDVTLEDTENFLRDRFPGFSRTSDSQFDLPHGKTLSYVPVPRLDISSTMIRERIRADRSIAFLVPGQLETVLRSRGREMLEQD